MLCLYLGLFLALQVGLSVWARLSPGVLGYASNVTVADLLNETNAKRAENGLGDLVLNQQLSDAAVAKGTDMFKGQYWAHTSPTGKDPWSFITAAGYRYLFAGENLARDFGDSHSIVEAWMQSPSHRDNLLNSRYKEIGFGVVNGKYGNYETTIVVQMFGTRSSGTPSVDAANLPTESPVERIPNTQVDSGTSGAILSVIPPPPPQNNVKIDVRLVTQIVSFGFIGIVLALLIIDMLLVYRQKTVRISGHNSAHILLFLALLVVLQLVSGGLIL